MLTLTQDVAQAAEHAHSDSVSGAAITRALTSGSIVNLKFVVSVILVLLFIGGVAIFAVELNSIRKAGGFKKWVTDVPLLEYRTVRMVYLSEGAIVVLTLTTIAHAIWPQIVGEIQTDMVWALFTFMGVSLGLNVTAFGIQRATTRPENIAAEAAAADPNTMPFVTRDAKTGVTTVRPVMLRPPPTQQQRDDMALGATTREEKARALFKEAGVSDAAAREFVPDAAPPALDFVKDD